MRNVVFKSLFVLTVVASFGLAGVSLAEPISQLSMQEIAERAIREAAAKAAKETAETESAAREVAEKSITLLKNDNNLLPLDTKKYKTIAVVGDLAKVENIGDYGSSQVHPPYVKTFMQAMEENYPDVKVTFIPTKKVKKNENTIKCADAVILLCGMRHGDEGEYIFIIGGDRKQLGLKKREVEMLRYAGSLNKNTAAVVMGGNVIRMSEWKDSINSILMAYYPGMEGGNAIADIIFGKVNPSGKLPFAIAKSDTDYPEVKWLTLHQHYDYYNGYKKLENDCKVPDFPYGFGLSYTSFSIDSAMTSDYAVKSTVTNTGNCPGKEVVQVYIEAPQGKIKKAKRVLVGFAKTRLLLPGESEEVSISFEQNDFASFDESGVTGYKNAYVLEPGEYRVCVGADSVTNESVSGFTIAETVCVKQCLDISASTRKNRILENIPQEIAQTGDKGIKLIDVKNGAYTMEEFVAQLSDEDLCDINRGEGAMGSSLGTEGNAGAYAGITESLRQKGIPAIITADGPAGLRVSRYTTLLPCGTAIACSFNEKLVEELFELVGNEAVHFGIDVNLAPGMNIHRNPLCGRNFEYFSQC